MIHHVFANRSNIGDWLSARGLQALLKPLNVREHLCDEPFVDETIDRLAHAGPEDLIAIGGGGLFMDYFEPFWLRFRAIARRVPFVIWGAGYCDLKLEASLPDQSLLESIIAQSSLCVVRDDLTRRHLSSCLLPQAVACPSVAAIPRARTNGFGVLHADNYSTAGAPAYELMCEAGQQYAERTGRTYRQVNNHIKDGCEEALYSVLDLYAKSDVILSSGLHGCVIGVAMGKKVLAVSGDYKIESFMNAAGLSEWSCDITKVDTVPERLERLSSQSSADEFIKEARRANKAVAEQVKLIYEKKPRWTSNLKLKEEQVFA
jgi:polysaccharide pyruvyl transferase WcaK-like protein